MSFFQRLLATLRGFYRRSMKRVGTSPVDAQAKTLRTVNVFQHLRSGALQDLASAVHVRSYRRDEVIYYENDPGLGFYVIQRGRVRLLTEDETGLTHELRQVDEYQMFGELSLFGTEVRRLETAQALTDVTVLGFFRPDLLRLVKRKPRSAAHILMALSSHFARRQSSLVPLLQKEENKVDAMRILDGSGLRRTEEKPA